MELMYVARPDDSKEYSWTHGPNPSLEALLEDLPNGYFVSGLVDRGSVCDRVCYAQWVDGKLQPVDW